MTSTGAMKETFFVMYAATYFECASPPVRMMRSILPSAAAARAPMARTLL